MAQPREGKCPYCGFMVGKYHDGYCPICKYKFNDEDDIPERKDVPEQKPEQKEKQGSSAGGVFVAVVLGIVVGVWLISKLFHIEITGTIVPMK